MCFGRRLGCHTHVSEKSTALRQRCGAAGRPRFRGRARGRCSRASGQTSMPAACQPNAEKYPEAPDAEDMLGGYTLLNGSGQKLEEHGDGVVCEAAAGM